jgi:hypothetical protein
VSLVSHRWVGIRCGKVGLQSVPTLLEWNTAVMTPPTYPDHPPMAPEPASWEDDEFWAAFDVEPDPDRPLPWYRKTARLVAALAVFGVLATGALIPWRTLIDRLDNVSDPTEIQLLAADVVAESPHGWLVNRVQVRDIVSSDVGGFVNSSPPDGIITLDLRGWDPDDVESVVAHEIGHLLDFAAYGDSFDRRDGLASEVWAECASVDAGFKRLDKGSADDGYYCTQDTFEQYQFAVSRLGEVCMTWGARECRVVAPIGNGP